MKKLLLSLLIIGLSKSSFASSQTILPKVEINNVPAGNYNCTLIIKRFHDIHGYYINTKSRSDLSFNSIKRFYCALDIYNKHDFTKQLPDEPQECKETKATTEDATEANDILGCAIITGRIKLYMYKMYILYFMRLLSMVSGSLSILFVIIGGYRYFIGALQNDVGEAKNTIINALTGLAISTGALIIVNLVQTFVSS